MIEVDDLGRRMPNGTWLWRHLSFSVEPGRITGLIGRNGSGKTTLLRTLQGLIEPHEGRVDRGGPVGHVPQQSAISFPFAVRDVVAMGRARHVHLFAGLARRDRDAICRAMERVGITALADRSFLDLSGGERQLVLIARAVATDCRTLVLDEPFTGLDLENQSQTLALIRALAKEDGVAAIFSAHQPDHLFAVADEAIVLRRGQAAIQGPLPITLSAELLTEIYGVDVRVIDLARGTRNTRHAVAELSA